MYISITFSHELGQLSFNLLVKYRFFYTQLQKKQFLILKQLTNTQLNFWVGTSVHTRLFSIEYVMPTDKITIQRNQFKLLIIINNITNIADITFSATLIKCSIHVIGCTNYIRKKILCAESHRS
jgi:hypothetical protein